jgi:hypothetical protein
MRDQVWMKLVGCLYCRHREQARSYSFDRVHPHQMDRSIGRYREQAMLLQKIKNKPPTIAFALHHSRPSVSSPASF